MKEKVTVLIPCKDEEHNIRACIESTRLLADEILVADSGSTDGTLQIVRQMGNCRVIEREFVGFADFKNWAIPQASHPWVLIVDADERVTKEVATEIRDTLESTSDSIDAYWIGRRNFFWGHEIKYSGWSPDRVCRLIRRDRCRYGDRPVHEEIEVAPNRTGRLRSKLLHYTIWTYDQYFQKRIYYTRLSAQHAARYGKRAGYWSLLVRPFLRFFQLYVLRFGFLDGLPGLQICMLTAFFNTYVRQGRLWEMEHANVRPQESSGAAVRASSRGTGKECGLADPRSFTIPSSVTRQERHGRGARWLESTTAVVAECDS